MDKIIREVSKEFGIPLKEAKLLYEAQFKGARKLLNEGIEPVRFVGLGKIYKHKDKNNG